jgi:hypothetical protein
MVHHASCCHHQHLAAIGQVPRLHTAMLKTMLRWLGIIQRIIIAYNIAAHGVCCVQDLSKEQADGHKVLVQPALEVAANATVIVLQQLIKNITEQVTKSHCILLRCLLAGLHKGCSCCSALHHSNSLLLLFHSDQAPLHVHSPEKLLIVQDLSGTLLSISWLRQAFYGSCRRRH